MSELDRLLRGRPSSAAWSSLVRQLDPWPAGVSLDAVDGALARWPRELRAAGEAWRAAREGDPTPWWPLVCHVELDGDDDLEAPDAVAALGRVTL
jgi:hypothetical protein